jgi:hypothetical protein
MEIEIAVICDAATVLGEKMNILGAFQTVRATTEPIVMPPFSIAVRIRFMKLEEGDKALRIGFVDADGHPVLPTINAQMPVRVPATESFAIGQIVLGTQQLRLPRFGEYSIDLAIDGRVEKSIPLFVKQIVPRREPPPAPQNLPAAGAG